MKKIKIGFFGDGPWSHESLLFLLNDSNLAISFICARSSKPDEVLSKIASQKGIKFLVHQDVNSTEFRETIAAFGCDLFISMSFDQIFGETFLRIPKLRTINCHAGKLPYYRGRNVLNWVLINDEKEFGITVHYVDQGVDTGDLILQRTFPIEDSDDYCTILDVAYKNCARILYDAVKLIQADQITAIKQSDIDPYGFYCSRRKPGDEIINWNKDSREIFNFVRALTSPGPVARTFLKGQELQIQKVLYYEKAPIFKGFPGAVLSRDVEGFFVKTGDSFVKVLKNEVTGSPKIGDRLG